MPHPNQIVDGVNTLRSSSGCFRTFCAGCLYLTGLICLVLVFVEFDNQNQAGVIAGAIATLIFTLSGLILTFPGRAEFLVRPLAACVAVSLMAVGVYSVFWKGEKMEFRTLLGLVVVVIVCARIVFPGGPVEPSSEDADIDEADCGDPDSEESKQK